MYQQLEPELVASLLASAGLEAGAETESSFSHEPSPQDHLDMEAFSEGWRQLDSCRSSLANIVLAAFTQAKAVACLTADQRVLIITVVLQRQPLISTAKALGFTGKAQLIAALRQALRAIV